MITILVSGRAKSVGKTTLAAKIIENLPGIVGAIKCSLEQGEDSLVTDNTEVTGQPGTDTAVFQAAGADKVVFLKSQSESLQQDLDGALQLVKGVDYLVVEGNSVWKYLKPGLTIYIEDEEKERKASAGIIEEEADFIVQLGMSKEKPTRVEIVSYRFNQDSVSCSSAHLISQAMRLSLPALGRKLNEQGIKVRHCMLGLF